MYEEAIVNKELFKKSVTVFRCHPLLRDYEETLPANTLHLLIAHFKQ